jgi:hypothetical protein
MQELSSLLLPNIAGIHPKFLDPRLISEAANRIRAISQITCDRYILNAMGLTEARITLVIKGDPFNNIEISNNLAFLTYCSSSPLAGVFPHLKIYFS